MKRTYTLNDLHQMFKPNEMPTMWGSPAKPQLSNKVRLFYGIAWLIVTIVAGLQNNFTIANIYEIQGYLGLTPGEGSVITSIYYMGNAWMTLILWKMRQQFGLNTFFTIVISILVSAHILELIFDTFYVVAFGRFINGLAGSGLSSLCMYYAMEMLPNNKKYLLMPLGLGLMQVGSPAGRWIAPYLMLNENAYMGATLQMGLALFALVAIILIQLPPTFSGKAFSKQDALPIGLYAIATAICCLVFSLGTTIWWEYNWMAYSLCVAIACFIGLFVIEVNRKDKPFINFSFVATIQVMKLALAGAFLRMCLVEQTTGATGLFRNVLGYTDYQLRHYYGIITLGALFGAVMAIVAMNNSRRIPWLLLITFVMIATGSFLSVDLSPFIMPSNLYFPQFLIAAASVFFMGPLLMNGIMNAMPRGTSYVMTFVGIFSFSQSVFGLLGSALITYFIKDKTYQYTQDIVNRTPDSSSLLQIDPNFATEVSKEAGTLAYSDMFFMVGCIASVIFILLALEWLYFYLKKTHPMDRELKLIGKKAQIAEKKTKILLEDITNQANQRNENA